MDIHIEVTDSPDPAEVEELVRSQVARNTTVASPELFSPVVVFARRDGELIGGASGFMHWGWLVINHLWVADSERGKDLGTELMSRIEPAAVYRLGTNPHVDTYDFQVHCFYKKLGYRVFGHSTTPRVTSATS